MDASLQDLVVCLAIWSVPTALLGLVGLLGDRAEATPADSAAGPVMAPGPQGRLLAGVSLPGPSSFARR